METLTIKKKRKSPVPFTKKSSKESIEKNRLAHIGFHHTEETKKKISINNARPMLGVKHSSEVRAKMSELKKGEKHNYFGKKLSIETRRKISNAQKGEKSKNWKGGITSKLLAIRDSIEIRLWREAVFARDNWTCQKTKKHSNKLVAHHIRNFSSNPELRFAIDNGITLLDSVHREFHKKYGFKKIH